MLTFIFFFCETTALRYLPPDSLVVLSDGRDVITNIHNIKNSNHHFDLYSSISTFRKSFESLTQHSPGSIVASTEAQCCVLALGHIKPGSLFDSNGNRTGRVCSSETPICQWKGDEEATPWHDFMLDLAKQHSEDYRSDIYLNAGLVAGRARDLISLIEAIDIEEEEDDQGEHKLIFRNGCITPSIEPGILLL